ncbi:HNH endonuclease [Aureimonas leprariae]|uniref:HNH endonuclease n=1 Tax=Plantimonas leprariae TaxID=2615207 RepID=A0A7V7PKV8_9HYPH|nr:HNH endonuclease [Aureimonas leprariae]KAB0676681.1 HNH endonuclease [Aureimonas leprariae]
MRRARLRWDEAQREVEQAAPEPCWLCGRLLGQRVEWHHPWPKSRGGRDTVPVHPICHRTIHACFTNKELELFEEEGRPLGEQPEMARFLGWIATKPPDFSAPTRRRR